MSAESSRLPFCHLNGHSEGRDGAAEAGSIADANDTTDGTGTRLITSIVEDGADNDDNDHAEGSDKNDNGQYDAEQHRK